MTLFAGIDIGTSGVKIVLVDEAGKIHAEASRNIDVERPHPGWSQQHPHLWWEATCLVFDQLAANHREAMARVAGIGLSGQMLGAVLLDKNDRPTHTCILWNDQRALRECEEFLSKVPDMGLRTAGNPDPGMTAPKLLWLATHEPHAFEQADVLMLPKDYVRLCLTGERASEPSDAAGSLLFDCRKMNWDGELTAAAGWNLEKLPPLIASHAEAGRLRSSLQSRWGITDPVSVAAGAGDNMACALGVGATTPGDAVVTLGTSGVLCTVDGDFHPAAHNAVLTNPHAAPNTYLSLGVVMSATQSLNWIASLCGMSVSRLADAVEAMVKDQGIEHTPIMRPSLTGIRTPHNRPDAGASVMGITAGTDAPALAYAIIEGVAFQFLDCYEAQRDAGVAVKNVTAVGGGSQNRFWVQLIATLFDVAIDLPVSSANAAASGAARLGSVACGEFSTAEALGKKPVNSSTVEPDYTLTETLRQRYSKFRKLPM